MIELEYTFKDQSLFDLAMTHRSVGKNNNERLEFLGDSVLNLVISEWLHQQTSLNEGQLSRLRSNLVNHETLFEIGTQLNLSSQVIVSQSEKAANGHKKPNLIADAVEATLGAIFVDGGFEAAKKIALTWYQDKLGQPLEHLLSKDSKSTLQEHCQKQGWDLPNYVVTKIEGQAHNQTFHVTLEANNLHATGCGKSRKLAEQSAAFAMIKQFGIDHD